MEKKKIKAVVFSEKQLDSVKYVIHRQFENVDRFVLTVPDEYDQKTYRAEWFRKFGKAYTKALKKFIRHTAEEFAKKK